MPQPLLLGLLQLTPLFTKNPSEFVFSNIRLLLFISYCCSASSNFYLSAACDNGGEYPIPPNCIILVNLKAGCYCSHSLCHLLTIPHVYPRLMCQNSCPWLPNSNSALTSHSNAKKLETWVKANYDHAMKAVAYVHLVIPA
ncbi:hypothetical protein DL96DRAFT_1771168 [Flagelloscypha sp. PMI_526]|nr:hypothetical protein DL96DRAFT_1771168 [Flagelloscypha sp. PMI_526]